MSDDTVSTLKLSDDEREAVWYALATAELPDELVEPARSVLEEVAGDE
jgi:hypothetical protein